MFYYNIMFFLKFNSLIQLILNVVAYSTAKNKGIGKPMPFMSTDDLKTMFKLLFYRQARVV